MLIFSQLFRPSHLNRISRLAFRSASSQKMSTTWIPNMYPPARRSDHVDVYKSEAKGQVKVADPYQWLEKNSAETNEWITAQEAFTKQYLEQASFIDGKTSSTLAQHENRFFFSSESRPCQVRKRNQGEHGLCQGKSCL